MQRGMWKGIGLLCFPLLIGFGCGGGGGGGGGGGLAYTGPTSQATINTTNAQKIVTNLNGSPQGAIGVGGSSVARRIPDPALSVQTPAGNYYGVYSVLFNLKPASTSTGKILLNKKTLHRLVDQGTETIPGDCPGSPGEEVVRDQEDDQTGNYVLTLTFKDYCAGGVTISGGATVSGNIDGTTDTARFSNLSVSYGSCSYTLTGDIEMESADWVDDVTMTMNVLSRDDATGKVSKYDSYAMEFISGSGAAYLSEGGRFYDPDYGYVDLTTVTPFRFDGTSTVPSAGVLHASGSNGTQARLTVGSGGTYRLDIDGNGDGVYESGLNGSWEDLTLVGMC